MGCIMPHGVFVHNAILKNDERVACSRLCGGWHVPKQSDGRGEREVHALPVGTVGHGVPPEREMPMPP